MRFEWDQAKNDSNMRKHGVSFDEAIAISRIQNSTRLT